MVLEERCAAVIISLQVNDVASVTFCFPQLFSQAIVQLTDECIVFCQSDRSSKSEVFVFQGAFRESKHYCY